MPANAGQQERNFRRALLARAIAVFFLLFTAADILLPQYFCPEEWQPLPVAVRQSLDPPLVNSEIPTPAPAPEESAPHEEDCFCCCAHVLPPALLSAATLFPPPLPAQAIIVGEAALPTPAYQTIYHPPRSA